jgi:hypothetical protein
MARYGYLKIIHEALLYQSQIIENPGPANS